MQRILKRFVFFLAILCLGVALPVRAADDSYGAAGAARLADEELTLAKMLSLAIEDEYLARGEYKKVIETFGERQPFTNIIKAEEKHISWLRPLFTKHDVVPPLDRGLELAKVPPTFAETFQIGVDAEIANIAMYERFLKKDLPADVRDVFNRLLAGSKNHLASFKKGVGKER